MVKELQTLVIGAGDRGKSWINHANTANAGMKAVAVADVSKGMREKYADKYGLSSDSVYESGEAALADSRDYDAVIIATPDKTHADLAVMALDKGYNVLLEKPMAVNEADCNRIVEASEKAGTIFGIGHVLRYSPLFSYVNDVIESGEMGKIVNMSLREDVAHWHFAHSYVRGNWGNSEQSSPVIIAKSCHDLDILSWWAKANPSNVNSTANRSFFTSENAPEGAKEKCIDCKVSDCLYDAPKFYLGRHTEGADGVRWPYSTISSDTSEEGRMNTLANTQFGNCVFGGCNSDQQEYQQVSIQYKNGINANFQLNAFGNLSNREFEVYFEGGEIRGKLLDRSDEGKILGGEITKLHYTGKRDDHKIERITMNDMNSHGGGDPMLIKNFADAVRANDPSLVRTSARESLQSHLIGFAAEKSRKEGRVIRL